MLLCVFGYVKTIKICHKPNKSNYSHVCNIYSNRVYNHSNTMINNKNKYNMIKDKTNLLIDPKYIIN